MTLNKEQLINIVAAEVKKTLNRFYIIPQTSCTTKKVNNNNNTEINSFDFLNKRLILENDVKMLAKQGYNTINVLEKTIITPAAKDIILHTKLKVNYYK